jgi:hypothetical protein
MSRVSLEPVRLADIIDRRKFVIAAEIAIAVVSALLAGILSR